tara:strand:- start:488 stop:643 length:156 start_codon:yes stop_codon:yes gene_type:complete
MLLLDWVIFCEIKLLNLFVLIPIVDKVMIKNINKNNNKKIIVENIFLIIYF